MPSFEVMKAAILSFCAASAFSAVLSAASPDQFLCHWSATMTILPASASGFSISW